MPHFFEYKIAKLKLCDNQLIYANENVNRENIYIVDKNRINI